MATSRFYDNVPAGGYISSDSEGEWCVDPYMGTEAIEADVVRPTPAAVNDEDVMIWDVPEKDPVVPALEEDVGARRVTPRRLQTSTRGRSRSLDSFPRLQRFSPAWSPATTHARSRSLDAVHGVNDVVDNQPQPVVQLEGNEDGEISEMQTDGGSYETMNLENNRGKVETSDVGTDTAMDAADADDEATTSGGGSDSIKIYCVCCSKQVGCTDNVRNRLCKDCIDIMVLEDGNDQGVNIVTTPCVGCSKPFEKCESQPQQLCEQCLSAMLNDCEQEPRPETVPVECTMCRIVFRQKSDKLRGTLCPHCQQAAKTPAVQNPPKARVSRQRCDNIGWADTLALQGYTATVVRAQLRSHFYKWCDGHKFANEAQGAHQCLDEFYALDVVRKVSSNLSPHMIVKMIHSMQMDDGVRLGKGAVKVVSSSLWDIYIADDPFLKMKQFRRGCPVCVRTNVEKTVERWGNRLCPARYRGQFGSLSRKLTYTCSP